MLYLAATAWEKIQTLPPSTWMKIGIAIASVIVAVFVIRKVMKMNKLIAGIVVLVSVSILFFSWVYNRNEPAFLTPLVERIAPFFPSAGAYQTKQQSNPKH